MYAHPEYGLAARRNKVVISRVEHGRCGDYEPGRVAVPNYGPQRPMEQVGIRAGIMKHQGQGSGSMIITSKSHERSGFEKTEDHGPHTARHTVDTRTVTDQGLDRWGILGCPARPRRISFKPEIGVRARL